MAVDTLAGRPSSWRSGLVELERVETDDPAQLLAFLDEHGLAGEPSTQSGQVAVAVLVGARGCARLGHVPEGRPSPAAVPECVAIAYRRGSQDARPAGTADIGSWQTSWTDAAHAGAVDQVRQAIARGEVYQANVVGHRSATFRGDPAALVGALSGLPGAEYGGGLAGDGWLVASGSPEQLVRVVGSRVTTVPIKGTASDPAVLRSSAKDRAEHVMIVDLERNDLARVTVAGSVTVDSLYDVRPWAGLWHASSTVRGQLAPGVGTVDVLRALAPGGSVTGAPKHAACRLLAGLEPVGRGPAMGALGFVWPGGMDLGLTIRTVAVADGVVHLWAGGAITWGSDPAEEVAEAHAKAWGVQQVLAQVRPSSS
jgi:para-aminobenzoate synthetase component 1